ASHPALLAGAHSIPMNDSARDLLLLRKRINPHTTVHSPGLVTPYDGVIPLFANCCADLEVSGRIAHRRFYPFGEVAREDDFARAYLEFEELFVEHIRLLSLFGPVGISLTAGFDSQSTFAVAQRHMRAG